MEHDVLEDPSRIVGVDVGTKRVGIAVSDPLRLFAQVEGTYSPSEALEVLRSMQQGSGIDAVVVGWPMTEAGKEGEATEMVEAFIERLVDRLEPIRVERRDERYTSEMAKDLLRRAGVSQPGRYDKGRVDAAAAAVVLQDYLDSRDR